MKNHYLNPYLYSAFLILCELSGTNIHAKTLYLPPLCGEEGLLLSENKGELNERFWLSYQSGSQTNEIGFDLLSGQKSAHTLEKVEANSSLRLFHHDLNEDGVDLTSLLHFRLACPRFEIPVKATAQVSPDQLFSLGDRASDFELRVSNLSWLTNEIRVEFLDGDGHTLTNSSFTLAPRKVLNQQLQKPARAAALLIRGEQRLTSLLIEGADYADYKTPSFHLVKPLGENLSTTGKYFELGLRHSPHSPRFIVRIENPRLIEKAQYLVAHPDVDKIVFGRVALGSGGFNYDSQESQRSPWSWHYSEVTNIDDFGSTSCNGTPESLEENLLNWQQNSNYACFWSYRLLREVSVEEIRHR